MFDRVDIYKAGKSITKAGLAADFAVTAWLAIENLEEGDNLSAGAETLKLLLLLAGFKATGKWKCFVADTDIWVVQLKPAGTPPSLWQRHNSLPIRPATPKPPRVHPGTIAVLPSPAC